MSFLSGLMVAQATSLGPDESEQRVDELLGIVEPSSMAGSPSGLRRSCAQSRGCRPMSTAIDRLRRGLGAALLVCVAAGPAYAASETSVPAPLVSAVEAAPRDMVGRAVIRARSCRATRCWWHRNSTACGSPTC